MMSNFRVFHWDTFDNETFQVGSASTLDEAIKIVTEKYGSSLRPNGADQVDIVDGAGEVVWSHALG